MFRYSNSSRTKRRRVIPARQKQESVPEPTPQIFENIRIYIHPSNINNSRRKVLHNLIQKNGGSYSLQPDGETTHVLVDECVSSGKLCRSLGWTTFPPNINVLLVSWLSASVRASRCLNAVDYEIPCTHRPEFATNLRSVAFLNFITGPANDVISDASTSMLPTEDDHDADVEMPNFEYVYEEGSTYDDGKYDDETSCDDEWLHETPIIPSYTIGILNSCNLNPCSTFPLNSFSSASNFKSLVSAPDCKKPKLNNIPPSPRPNTLAAQLSRVRVRRVPEHLRVPGGSSVIVDLNKEFLVPQASSENTANDETDQNAISSVLDSMQTSSTDEKCKKVRMQCRSLVKSKTGTKSHYQDASTESGTEVFEEKSKKRVIAFSDDEEFANEISHVVKKMINTVEEVAVNAKIINESVVEISKNAMGNDDCDGNPLKRESIVRELVSDVINRVVDEVVAEKAVSNIKMDEVEGLNTGCKGISELSNQENTRNTIQSASTEKNKVNSLENASQVNNQPPVREPVANSIQNRRPFVEESWIPQRVSQLSIVLLPRPYPVRLYSSVGHNVDNDQRQEPVECITPEIEHPSSSESLENEMASNTKSEFATKDKTAESEVQNQTRSCGRPDISGPNIFFPFPNASSSASTSSNCSPQNAINQRSASSLVGSCVGPNDEIIKNLRLLFESFKKTGEKWRSDVYEKAISLLAKYRKRVESLEEIESLIGISKKIAQKIWECAQTGTIRDVDEICDRQSEETRKMFSRAWGISPLMARKLWKEGHNTINDLWLKSDLSRSHLVGLRYYEDLKTKMTKKEATRIFLTVLKVIFEIYPDVQCDACSSLRRNKKNCGHVSILVALPKGCLINDHRALPNIVAKLHQLGYITDDLIRHEENGDQTKYVGIFKLGSSFKNRRIEITVCTREEYACALMHLTGSSYFKRAIHQWALKREMVLDEHSLRIRLLNPRVFITSVDCT